MKTIVRFPLIIGLVVMMPQFLGCSETFSTSNGSVPSVPSAETAKQAPEAWSEILGATSAPAGWRVRLCENPVLLCVEADGELIGTVERFSFYQQEAPPPGTEQAFLTAWVEDYYRAIEQDRAVADGALQFTAQPPEEVTVGGLPGLRYGFRVTHPDGRLFERSLGYVTLEGATLQVFTTGMLNGDPTGHFSSEEGLDSFAPHLAYIMEELTL